MGRPLRDITGQQFGRVKVLSFVGRIKGNASFECECSCGSKFVTRGCRLVNGSTKSCGCLRLETVRHGEHHRLARKKGVAFRQYLEQYKANAKTRGLVWELTEEKFKELTSSPCHYTGILPSLEYKGRNRHDTYVCNGVDRRDNAKGYTVDNCVPCCFEVNAMKRDFSEERFIALCTRVAERAAQNVFTDV